MLCEEDFMTIKTLCERGVYLRDIALTLGTHPKPVSRALKRGSSPSSPRRRRSSKLDRFKPKVDHLLAEGVWNAVVILRKIQTEGYQGGMIILRKYIAPKQALRPGRAPVRFETKSGEQLQSYWGELETELAGQPTRVHFIVNQLSFSRRFRSWCTDRAGRRARRHLAASSTKDS
jgi:transposase